MDRRERCLRRHYRLSQTRSLHRAPELCHEVTGVGLPGIRQQLNDQLLTGNQLHNTYRYKNRRCFHIVAKCSKIKQINSTMTKCFKINKHLCIFLYEKIIFYTNSIFETTAHTLQNIVIETFLIID